MGFFDNCEPKQRFNAYSSNSFPWGPTTWQTIDWDHVPEYIDVDDDDDDDHPVEQCVTQALSRLVDQLDDNVNLVNFSVEGDFILASSDLKDETAAIPLYCPIDMIPEEYRTSRVVPRADLVEIDRLSRCVDLVTYKSQPGSRAVFKYQFHHEQARRNWHELNCWLRLSGHPKIVPLECLVTDYEDVPGLGHGTGGQVVVGFTSTFIPGGTFDENTSPLFKLKHLEQLIGVVDDLNLRFGIVHQDLAPRNLLVDPVTDTLQLFDLSCSGKLGRTGSAGHQHFTNSGSFAIDLKGVVATAYEIITWDTQLVEQILLGADVSTIEDKEWIKHPDVSLDKDVEDYRKTIRDWLHRRSQPENLITHYTQALDPLEWPEPWKPEIPCLDENGDKLDGDARPTTCVPRIALRSLGLRFVEWERPAHNRIPDGFRMLGNGRLIVEADLEGAGEFTAA